MQRIVLLVFTAFILSINLFGQNKSEYFKNLPGVNDSTPAWARLMYSEDPDVREVERLYTEYYRNNPYEKNLDARNYKFWFRKIVEFVDENGKIRPPSAKVEDAKWNFLKNKKANQAQNAPQEKTPGTWINLGPSETYTSDGNQTPVSWQANIYSLDQSQSNPNILYAGTEAGGVFKTTDKGLNWSLISANEVFVSGILSTRIHPTDPNIVYVGANSRIYKTTDGGTNWNEMFNLGTTPQRLFIHQTDHDTVFCASNNGFHRSYDAGATWTQIFTESTYDIESHPTDHDTLYLTKTDATEKRSELFRTLDGGANWTQMTNGWYSPAVLAEARDGGSRIAVTPINPDYIYVALIGESKIGDLTVGDKGWIGIYQSTDAGATWSNPNGPDGGLTKVVGGQDSVYYTVDHPNLATQNWAGTSFTQGFYNFGFAASHTTSGRLWVGNLSWYETSNDGADWEPLGGYAGGSRHSNAHPDVQDLLVLGSDIWYATDGGIDYSNDEMQTKASRKKGITAVDYWGFGSGWNEDVLVGGRYHNGNGGYLGAYGIGNHIRLGGGESPTGHVDPLKERTGYFNDISTAKIPTTLNQSVIYSPKLGMYPTTHYWESYSSELEFDPRYAGHMYLGNTDGFWKSTDGGANFSRLFQFPTNSRVQEIEICRSNPDVIYAEVKNSPGGYWDWSTVWRSADGGNTFMQVTTPPGNSRRGIHLSHNPLDENEVWASIVSAGNGTKVFKTTDGGTNWTNLTTAALDGESIKDIQYVGGAVAKAYIVTNVNVYYFNENTSDWVAFATDLPLQTRALQMRPFFRDGKMRLATGGRGIFETDFFDEPTPVAQPMTFVDSVFCSRDTVELECYSILNHSGATWNWTVTPAPQYISSTTARNPKVVLGADGNYTITLAVTDGNGATDSKTINDMIVVQSSCEPDSTAGNALKTVTNGDRFISQEADLQNITNFTVTAWIKPNAGNQEIAAGIVSDGAWCFHCRDRHGFIYNYNGNRLWYAWPGNESSWSSNSGLDPMEEEWNYVALVIYPDSAIMYLNEERYVDVRTLSPGKIYNLNVGYGHYSRSFQGDMDEVTVWDRSLTRDEIREMRHLTKTGATLSDPNLVAYYQFTELLGGTQMMDIGGTNHGTLSGTAALTKSNVPIGAGTMQRLSVDASNLVSDFSNAGAKLYFNDCQPPLGEMVVSRLTVDPYSVPNANNNGDNYWIMNYYGDDSDDFSFIDSIELTPSDPSFLTSLSKTENAAFHIRNPHDTTQTWNSTAYAKNQNSGALTFNRAISVDSSLQIVVTDGATAFAENIPENYCEPDTIAERALNLPGGSGSDYAIIPALNLNSNTVTMSAWVKSGISHNNTAGVIFSRGGTTTSGIHLSSNNELRYHWDGGKWGWSSGAFLPVDEWAHIALVVESNKATMYLNGIPYINNSSHSAEAFDNQILLGRDQGFGSRRFTGEMDEVCIWDRSLSQNEIRELMHLTKEDLVTTDPNLQVYMQFNEETATTYDKSPNRNHGSFNGNTGLVTSSAPIGSGVSDRADVTTSGAVNFPNTGITLGFPATGTYPDGEILTSKINSPPNELPGDQVVSDSYWIIRNFGTNATFSALDSISFSDVKTINSVHEGQTNLFNLHKRSSNEHLDNWTLENGSDFIEGQGNDKGKVSFNTGNGQTGFSQFVISDDGRGVRLSAKAMLEGAFSSGVMTDYLRVQNYLPTDEPYLALGFNHQAGGGEEEVENTAFVPSGNDAIVDWVMLELRDKNNSSTVLHTRSALIQADGDIVDMDGVSSVYFRQAVPDDYYVAVRHRNHLGAMALNVLTLSSTTTTVDFTSVSTYGTNAQKDLGSGVMGLWSADVNHDGFVNSADLTTDWANRNQLNYHPSDTNFDGKTDAKDRSKIWNGRGVSEQLP